ncbi:MAG: GTPase HflX [Thaumarchaeota archaeon]|nr:GTPase HflX [Nitrososphaerota archaeon]
MPTSSNTKAILVTYPDRFRQSEAVSLAEAAGYEVVQTFTQRFLFKAQYGVGAGKATEIASAAKDKDVSVILFDEKLKPIQLYNLAKLVGIEVVDREKLILQIFARRIVTAEAKLQVKLAELRYEMAGAREKVRLAKRREQPGFFGLGRYDVEIYNRDLKARISTLQRKLEKIVKRRSLYQRQRNRMNIATVSLAGYTGAGKTSLFNALTGEEKEVGAGTFTSLATTTRSITIDGSKVLLSDTVGFISGLPLYMIEAFKSTLEELTHSALVLLLVDASEPPQDVLRRFDDSINVLTQLEVSPSKTLIILNKADQTTHQHLNEISQALHVVPEGSVGVSAKTGLGLANLKKRIYELIFEYDESTTTIPPSDIPSASDEIEWLKNNASVNLTRKQDGGLEAHVNGPSWIVERFKALFGVSQSPNV